MIAYWLGGEHLLFFRNLNEAVSYLDFARQRIQL